MSQFKNLFGSRRRSNQQVNTTTSSNNLNSNPSAPAPPRAPSSQSSHNPPPSSQQINSSTTSLPVNQTNPVQTPPPPPPPPPPPVPTTVAPQQSLQPPTAPGAVAMNPNQPGMGRPPSYSYAPQQGGGQQGQHPAGRAHSPMPPPINTNTQPAGYSPQQMYGAPPPPGPQVTLNSKEATIPHTVLLRMSRPTTDLALPRLTAAVGARRSLSSA